MARLKTQAQLEQERQEAIRYTLGAITLPLDQLLLIYARQSSKKQVIHHAYSTLQQTRELIARGLELGWKRDNAILYVENRQAKDGGIRSVSGTLRIDQRPGLQTLTDVIDSGKAGAVMAVDVSRFFRDEDMIEPATFVKKCKKHRVIVITNDAIYDFNNPQREDVKAFLAEAQVAADFIKKHIKGKMLKGRSLKAKEGLLANGIAPIGLMRDKTGDNLMPSPHAHNVNALYHRFEELGASLAQLHKEIIGKPVFPDVEGIDPGTIFLTRVSGGWTVKSRAALKYILTNPMYAGHLQFDGRIVKRNAHPAIVDPDVWQFAFEHLSTMDLDGVPIERTQRTVRFSRKGYQTDALLSGVRQDGRAVLEGNSGKHVYVQANTSKSGAAYTLKDYHEMSTGYYDAGISVPELDRIFAERLVTRLQLQAHIKGNIGGFFSNTALPETMHDTFVQMNEQDTTNTGLNDAIEMTRTELTRVKRHIDVAGDIMEDRELRDAYATKARLSKRLSELESKQASLTAAGEELRAARRDLMKAPELWETWSIERQRRFIRLVTQSITLEQLPGGEGWLRLTIVWCPFAGWSSGDVAYIWRQSGRAWTEDETALLRARYLKSSKAELLKLFPARSWTAISSKWWSLDLNGTRGRLRSDTSIPDYMSLSDRDVMERYELRTDEGDKRVWWHSLATENGDCGTRASVF